MTEQIEDIFNFKKKIDNHKKMSEIDDTTHKFNNNHIKYSKEVPQNLKCRDDEYDLGKIVESNIIIDKNDTIRLELRHPGEYKRIITEDGRMEESSDYSLKNGGDDGKDLSNDVEYINGSEDQENEVPCLFY